MLFKFDIPERARLFSELIEEQQTAVIDMIIFRHC